MPHNDQPTVHRVEQALARGPAGVEMLLVGDLNALLVQTRDQWEEDMTIAIVNYRLVDQSLHFITRRRYRGKVGWSCRMLIDRIYITGKEDYILDTDHRYFYNVGIREPIVSTGPLNILYKLKRGVVSRNYGYCKEE